MAAALAREWFAPKPPKNRAWKLTPTQVRETSRHLPGYFIAKPGRPGVSNASRRIAEELLTSLSVENATHDDISDALKGKIDASRKILALENDWDDEGALRIEETTWERATTFLKRAEITLLADFDRKLVLPEILPGPFGSVDLLWESTGHRLLINFPNDAEEPAKFYGDDFNKLSIKGKFPQDKRSPALICQIAEYSE